MNAEFIAVLEYWEREKGISKDTLIRAVEESLVAAAKKAVGAARDLRCTIDPKSGDIKAWAKLIVSEQVNSKHDEITVAKARTIKADAQIGDEVEVEVTPKNFGRIAAQYAKQSLLMHVRKAEKALIYDEFKDRTGDIVSGVVRRFERSDVVVDLGRYEALLPNRERVPTEEYSPGERIRCFVKAVENTNYGPEIILSRSAPDFVRKLFSLEVSEIANGTVQIKGIAREPGYRTKLAVYSTDDKVDPVGACVGLRGQRVKNIVRELNNEKMDIIKWDTDVVTYITNALAPASLDSFEIDEVNRAAKILVVEDQLSLAIGKRGQNARLASRLTGWQINIEAKQSAAVSFEDKITETIDTFAKVPGVDEDTAKVLVHSGFHALADLLQVEEEDLNGIEGIGDNAGAVLAAIRAEVERQNQSLTEQPAAAE